MKHTSPRSWLVYLQPNGYVQGFCCNRLSRRLKYQKNGSAQKWRTWFSANIYANDFKQLNCSFLNLSCMPTPRRLPSDLVENECFSCCFNFTRIVAPELGHLRIASDDFSFFYGQAYIEGSSIGYSRACPTFTGNRLKVTECGDGDHSRQRVPEN